jgi:hypothetical protein
MVSSLNPSRSYGNHITAQFRLCVESLESGRVEPCLWEAPGWLMSGSGSMAAEATARRQRLLFAMRALEQTGSS